MYFFCLFASFLERLNWLLKRSHSCILLLILFESLILLGPIFLSTYNKYLDNFYNFSCISFFLYLAYKGNYFASLCTIGIRYEVYDTYNERFRLPSVLEGCAVVSVLYLP